MNGPIIKTHVHEQAGTIILNRPEKRNAISRDLLASLIEALSDMHQDRRVRAVILTGSGSAFCAGMDLEEMFATAQDPQPQARWQQDVELYQELLERMLEFPKPLIAAVNGPALAGGAGIVLASDIVVAAEASQFGLPEPRRGLTAGIVAPLLAFRAGGGYSGYLLMTAQVIDAAEAHRVGLFHHLVRADHLWPRALELAQQCAACAPESLQLTKRMLNETIGENLRTLLSAGAAVSATARTTDAAKEGLAAFLQKRTPRWP